MEKKWIDLTGRIVIVTGGSMGIGEAIVEDLKNCGAKTAIFDMAEPKPEALDDNTMFIKLDIRNKSEVEAAVAQVVERFGTVDALVNNAGVTRPRILVDYYKERPEYELSEEDFDFLVSINEKGTFLVSQAVTRVMLEKGKGVIVNMSSEAGLRGSVGHSCYAATKAAVHSFTQSWGKELGKFGIRVLGIAPGILDRTPANNDEKYRAQAYGRGMGTDVKPEQFFKNYKTSIPLGRPGHLSEVADVICYLISDHASYLTGITIPVGGGKD
ncbi:sorbitol-6-phosphate 2-dehydrogenase [Lachnoclostridium sp. An131]|uniref:sorbitol-6-phosphate dehydrogenase subunit n=1 Tax=Lachnoclostridium sp. An131 TaxID=1965555 RepID=UPI000B392D63|nr:sorbitol-6-phosphate dehydrogenase subunit [Lachnoclostridium sp. An131]OUQ23761.1 sorbitol-6-phosphate 2-dehydrogenase [Lachnoclostridium sp. An131]